MTNERARARALCMNEYDRNIVSLLSKLFNDLLLPMKNETWDASLFFSSVLFPDRRRMVEGGNRTFRSLSLLLLLL